MRRNFKPAVKLRLGLCESSFLLLEYSVWYVIEYSSNRLI